MSLSVRNYVLAAAMLLLSAGAFFVGWDFLQLNRRLPELVAAEERADLITVDKSARTLTLSRGGTVLATYPVSLGSTPAGHKTREGDGRTPPDATSSIPRTAAAAFTSRSMSPIRILKTARARDSKEWRRAATL
jgi:hypothetical protein